MINNKYPTTKPSLNLDFANTKSLDPRITFRRGTPGTYYDGVTHVKAEENLIDYSEDFSEWGKTGNLLNPLLVQGASPVGTNAYKLICDNTTVDYSFSYIPISKENYLTSYSIFIKADGLNYAWIGFCYDTTLKYQSFVVDLTSGQILNQYTKDRGSLISVDVVSLGNDWYRVEFISDGHDANYFSIGGIFNPDTDLPNDGRPYFQGDNTSGILLWGAQIEDRGYVTSYTATNGTPITKYQPKLMTAAADHARFDHDPITGESKGLLIEESRTNLIDYSEDFDDDYWTHPRANVYTNSIAPDGTRSATELVANVSASGGMSIYKQSVITISSPFTTSCYFKKGDNDYAAIWVNDAAGSGTNQYFNILNGTVESGITFGSVSFTINDASIQDVGNGWFRCSVTITTDATSVRSQFAPSLPTGDGSNLSCTIYETRGFLWGAQLETGSFPASYIKTTGASATRSADNASITGENFSSWYRQDEGSLYVETSTFDTSGVASRSRITLGDSSDRIFTANGENSLYIQTVSGGTQAQINNSNITNEYYKKAIGLKDNDFAISFNGNLQIDLSGMLPFVDSLFFKEPINSTAYLNGYIKKLAYYPQRLTNEQLQNLTK